MECTSGFCILVNLECVLKDRIKYEAHQETERHSDSSLFMWSLIKRLTFRSLGEFKC